MKLYIIKPMYASLLLVIVFVALSSSISVFTIDGKQYLDSEYELIFGGNKVLNINQNSITGLKSYRPLTDDEKKIIREKKEILDIQREKDRQIRDEERERQRQLRDAETERRWKQHEFKWQTRFNDTPYRQQRDQDWMQRDFQRRREQYLREAESYVERRRRDEERQMRDAQREMDRSHRYAEEARTDAKTTQQQRRRDLELREGIKIHRKLERVEPNAGRPSRSGSDVVGRKNTPYSNRSGAGNVKVTHENKMTYSGNEIGF